MPAPTPQITDIHRGMERYDDPTDQMKAAIMDLDLTFYSFKAQAEAESHFRESVKRSLRDPLAMEITPTDIHTDTESIIHLSDPFLAES